MAMIVVTHDIGVVRQISNRLYVMKDGVTVESGPTDSVLRAPSHEYTKMLLNADPSRHALSPASEENTDQARASNVSLTIVETDESTHE